MGLVFFALIGLGPFAVSVGSGVRTSGVIVSDVADLQHRLGTV